MQIADASWPLSPSAGVAPASSGMTYAGAIAAHRSRHRIGAFRLLMPATPDEAAEMLDHHSGSAVAMAGGLEVIDRMKRGFMHETVVDLARTCARPAMLKEGSLVIGTMTRHADIASSDLVPPSLAAAFGAIANARIRAQGTVIGNILSRRPTYCAAPVLAALGAACDIDAGGSRQTIALGDALRLAEGPCFVRSVRIADVADWSILFERGHRPLLSVALAWRRVADTWVVRLGVGCAHPVPATAHAALPRDGLAPPHADAVALLCAQIADPTLGTPDERAYRRRILPVVVSRLLRRAGVLQ